MPDQITIRKIGMIVDADTGDLRLTPDNNHLGVQYEHNVTCIHFARPSQHNEDELWLYWDGFSPVTLGKKNEFMVENYLLQGTGIILQIAFHRNGEAIKRSDKIHFVVDESLLPGNMTPEPLPDPMGELINRAVVDLQPAENDMIYGVNLTGDKVTEIYLPYTGGGSDGLGVYHQSFVETDWEPYLTDYQLIVPASVHRRGLNPSVLEVLREDEGFSDTVIPTSRRYANGNISLITNQPFSGQVAIA